MGSWTRWVHGFLEALTPAPPAHPLAVPVLSAFTELIHSWASVLTAVAPLQIGEQCNAAAAYRARDAVQVALDRAGWVLENLDVPDEPACEALANAFQQYIEAYENAVGPAVDSMLAVVDHGNRSDKAMIKVSLAITAASSVEKSARQALLDAAEPFDPATVRNFNLSCGSWWDGSREPCYFTASITSR